MYFFNLFFVVGEGGKFRYHMGFMDWEGFSLDFVSWILVFGGVHGNYLFNLI